MIVNLPIAVFGPNDLEYLAMFFAVGMIGTILTSIGAYFKLTGWRTPLGIFAFTLAVPGVFILLGWFFSALLG